MTCTNLPTDAFVSRLESILETAESPQRGLDGVLQELAVCCGIPAGLTALQLPGEHEPRLLAAIGLPEKVLSSQGLERGITLTLHSQPPAMLFRRKVIAAIPLPSTSGYQGVLIFFGSRPPEHIDCLYASAAALGSWAERQRRDSSLPADATQLLRSRNTLRALFDNLPLSLYIIDDSYTLMALNKSRADRAHAKPSGLVGHKCYRALFGRTEPCAGCLVMESLVNGVSTSRVWRHGSRRMISSEWEISTFPVPGAGGDALEAILMEVDITEKSSLEASLVQSEKMAAIGQLAAGVAHEINNPLAAISANAQILSRDLPPESPLQESVDLIVTASNRAVNVVSRLLGYSRREEYAFKSLDVNENIRKCAALLQHQLDKQQAGLQLDLADSLPRIYASDTHLESVWTNLVLNALDAAGPVPLKICISTARFDHGVQVTVTDNGIGISAAEQQRIFEPFFTTKGAGRGTGLGLSICQRIIRHHGGTIEVQSRPAVGTRFIIHLPKKPPVLSKQG